MEKLELGTVIASRELSLDDGGNVTIDIGQPYPVDGGQTYFCPYRIRGIGSGKIRRMGGVDSMQALFLALQMIGADLYTSKEARAQRLKWCDATDLGFPVSEVIADLVPKKGSGEKA